MTTDPGRMALGRALVRLASWTSDVGRLLIKAGAWLMDIDTTEEGQ